MCICVCQYFTRQQIQPVKCVASVVFIDTPNQIVCLCNTNMCVCWVVLYVKAIRTNVQLHKHTTAFRQCSSAQPTDCQSLCNCCYTSCVIIVLWLDSVQCSLGTNSNYPRFVSLVENQRQTSHEDLQSKVLCYHTPYKIYTFVIHVYMCISICYLLI